MKGVKGTQILGQLMLTFIEAGVVFAAVITKETGWIVIASIFSVLWLLFLLQAIKIIKLEDGKKLKHDFNYTYFIVLIIVASIFVVLCMAAKKDFYYRLHGAKTTAVIYDITKEVHYERDYDEDGNSYDKRVEECDIYIEYEVGGRTYKNKYDIQTCNHHIGDKVTIYADKEKPDEFVSRGGSMALLAGIILAGVSTIIVIYKGVEELIHPTEKKTSKKATGKKNARRKTNAKK